MFRDSQGYDSGIGGTRESRRARHEQAAEAKRLARQQQKELLAERPEPSRDVGSWMDRVRQDGAAMKAGPMLGAPQGFQQPPGIRELMDMARRPGRERPLTHSEKLADRKQQEGVRQFDESLGEGARVSDMFDRAKTASRQEKTRVDDRNFDRGVIEDDRDFGEEVRQHGVDADQGEQRIAQGNVRLQHDRERLTHDFDMDDRSQTRADQKLVDGKLDDLLGTIDSLLNDASSYHNPTATFGYGGRDELTPGAQSALNAYKRHYQDLTGEDFDEAP